MNKKKSLEKSLKHEYARQGAEIKISAKMDKRILDDALVAFGQTKEKEVTSKQLSSGKRFSRHRVRIQIIKLAAAAAMVLAVFLIFDPFGGTEIAWGNVAERVEQIQTFLFRMSMNVSDTDSQAGEPEELIRWTTYLSSEYGFRMDTHLEGELTMQVFVPPAEDHMIWVIPKEAKAVRVPVIKNQLQQVKRKDRDPRQIISEFMALGYSNLGRKIFNGIEVEGIEVLNPPTSGNPLENSVGRIWVDTESELPVRLEIEGAAGEKVVRWIMDCEWNKKFEDEVFKPDMPVDSSTVPMFPKLFDREYGILVAGLTLEQACENIIIQFWQALLMENFPLIRKLLPVVADMSDAEIRKVLEMDSAQAAKELLNLGEPVQETINVLGPVIKVPCVYSCKDGKTRQISLLIQFRQYGAAESCVIYGDAGDKQILE